MKLNYIILYNSNPRTDFNESQGLNDEHGFPKVVDTFRPNESNLGQTILVFVIALEFFEYLKVKFDTVLGSLTRKENGRSDITGVNNDSFP